MTTVTKDSLIEALGVFKELMDAQNEAVFVKKDGAKVLSTNDFTDALKAKLEGITDEEISREDIAALFAGNGND